MGGAGVATVNDETALLINPAALGRLRDYFITIADPELDLSEETERIAGLDILKMRDPQEALNKTLSKPGRHLHTRAQVFPSIVVPNFGFGVFGKYEINAQVDADDTTRFLYDYTNDYAAVFGFNFRFLDGMLKIGANARITNRVEVRESNLDSSSTDLSLESLAKEGIGVGSDVGLMLAAPIVWLPTIGAVYRDAGRTSYTLRDGMFYGTSDRPQSTATTADVALAIHPIHGNRFRSTWTVEYRDVLTYGDETHHMRRLHGGFEFNYADALFLRGGMNQGYWTAGIELAIINYQFQAATYGEEIGTGDAARDDRRYVVKFSFRF